jgi:hypothetical protein
LVSSLLCHERMKRLNLSKKLAINTETLRVLTNNELSRVNGGARSSQFTTTECCSTESAAKDDPCYVRYSNCAASL